VFEPLLADLLAVADPQDPAAVALLGPHDLVVHPDVEAERLDRGGPVSADLLARRLERRRGRPGQVRQVVLEVDVLQADLRVRDRPDPADRRPLLEHHRLEALAPEHVRVDQPRDPAPDDRDPQRRLRARAYNEVPGAMRPVLSESRALRLTFFPALYLAQGLPWGFVSVGFGVLLADAGLDSTAIGAALGLAYLPWSFKVLWGPLLDAVPPLRIGRRRPFVVFAEALMGLTLLALGAVDPKTGLPLASALLFLNNTFASLQDVATDALAVDVLHEDERGRANALMWAGKSLGVSIGGGGGLLLAKDAGWPALFATLAGLVWAVALLPLWVRERPPSLEDRPVDARLLRLGGFLVPFVVVGAAMYALSSIEADWVSIVQPFLAVGAALLAWPLVDRAGFAAMRASFSFPMPWIGLLVAMVTPVGYAMVQAPSTRLLRAELHLPEETIATLSGVVDPLSGVVGALIGGVLADRFGVRRSMGGAMAVIGACLLGFALAKPWWPDFWFLVAFTAVFTLAVNAYSSASFGAFMTLSNPKVGATHFAVYMAATNLTYSWASPLGGAIADRWGYAGVFVLGAVVQVATIAVLVPLDPHRAAEVYRRRSDQPAAVSRQPARTDALD
jgi:PAT family beta-lactamase induction signal transducer AmpG